MQNNLFTEQVGFRPLAARMRPESLEDYVGQMHLVGPGSRSVEPWSRGNSTL